MHFILHPLCVELDCPAIPLRDELQIGMDFKGGRRVDEADSLEYSKVRVVYTLAGEDDELEDVTPAAGGRPVQLECGLILRSTEGGYVVVGEDVTITIDPTQMRAAVRLGPSLRGPLSESQRACAFYLLTIPLVLLFAHEGLFPLHAAALAKDDKGVVISAAKGHGKTTAALMLIEEGWSYLSDDTILLRKDINSVCAFSFRRSFSLTSDTLENFSLLADHAWPRSPGVQEKHRVDPERVYPGSHRTSVRPSVILLPERTDSQSHIEPVSSTSVFVTLVRQSAFVGVQAGSMQHLYLDVLGMLTRQCAAYRLFSGPDLLSEPRRLGALVRAILQDV